MAKSSEEIEDEVRAILLKAKKKLEDSWGDIYFGRAQMPPNWRVTQEAMVREAISRARRIMAENRLKPDSVALFERYRIAELQRDMEEAVLRLAFKATSEPPDPEPKLSSRKRKRLKLEVNEFIHRLKSLTLPELPPDQAKEAMARIEAESALEWQALRPQLDLDLDLQRPAYERWQAELQRLSQESGRARHLAAKFEKILVQDLPPTARPRAQMTCESSGLFYDLYADGQLRRLVRFHKGAQIESLDLSHRVAEGKWEDSANVAEFHKDNSLDEYGGRYERESRYAGSFRDWVKSCIRQMSPG